MDANTKAPTHDTANTVVGSIGAIAGAVGITAIAAAAPLTGAVITLLGAGVAAGALYNKLAGKKAVRENSQQAAPTAE